MRALVEEAYSEPGEVFTGAGWRAKSGYVLASCVWALFAAGLMADADQHRGSGPLGDYARGHSGRDM